MIEETATVIDREPGLAWVETIRNSACGSCAARAGCGQPLMARVLGESSQQKRNQLPVVCDNPPPVGSQVKLGIPETSVLQGAFMLYMVPLLALISGALALHLLSGSDGLAMAGAAAGFLGGLWWVGRWQRRWQKDDRWRPRIMSVLPADLDDDPEVRIAVKVL